VVAAGQLDQYPRTTRSRREVVRQVVDLRTVEPGLSVAQLAGRLGMTYAALEIALRRARADGEPV
jgi:DNA-directed RNA polymerase specialized sigma24 family protein